MNTRNDSSNVLQFRPVHTKTRQVERTVTVDVDIYTVALIHVIAVYQWLCLAGKCETACAKVVRDELAKAIHDCRVNELLVDVSSRASDFISRLHFITVLNDVVSGAEAQIDRECSGR